MGALNALAFEPLQYPEEPEEKKRSDLVLYICRVPGTRGAYTIKHVSQFASSVANKPCNA